MWIRFTLDSRLVHRWDEVTSNILQIILSYLSMEMRLSFIYWRMLRSELFGDLHTNTSPLPTFLPLVHRHLGVEVGTLAHTLLIHTLPLLIGKAQVVLVEGAGLLRSV